MTRRCNLPLALLMFAALIAGPTARPSRAAAQNDCASPAHAVGLAEQYVLVDGMARSFLLYVPAGYDPATPSPLILSYHGFTSSPEEHLLMTRWNNTADQMGAIIVYPRGSGQPARWNTGGSTPFLTMLGIQITDDVAFTHAVIEAVQAALCIDAARIYASGFSNGGGMVDRLTCEMSETFAAVGMVSGAYSPPEAPCEPTRPVPILALHGTDDPIVPYGGGSVLGFDLLPAAAWAANWGARYGCAAAPETLETVGAVSGVRYTACDDDTEVIFYTISGGGHLWPGTPREARLPRAVPAGEIDATALLWSFFTTHRR